MTAPVRVEIVEGDAERHLVRMGAKPAEPPPGHSVRAGVVRDGDGGAAAVDGE